MSGGVRGGGARGVVPLSKTAVAALRAHRTRQNEERLRLGELWQDHDLVFPNRVGKPMDHGNLYDREYKPLLRSAGSETRVSPSTAYDTPSQPNSSINASAQRSSSPYSAIPLSRRRWIPTPIFSTTWTTTR
jgi:hypothetical protein